MNTKLKALSNVGLKGKESKENLHMKASHLKSRERLYKLGGKMVPLQTLLESRKK